MVSLSHRPECFPPREGSRIAVIPHNFRASGVDAETCVKISASEIGSPWRRSTYDGGADRVPWSPSTVLPFIVVEESSAWTARGDGVALLWSVSRLWRHGLRPEKRLRVLTRSACGVVDALLPDDRLERGDNASTICATPALNVPAGIPARKPRPRWRGRMDRCLPNKD